MTIDTDGRSARFSYRLAIISILLFNLAVNFAGIRKDLPFVAGPDEDLFIGIVNRMVSNHTLNPGWFGNPASTILYPCAAICFVNSNLEDSLFFSPDGPTSINDFPVDAYVFGRLLAGIYGVLSIFLVFLLGRLAFGPRVGILGALLFTFYPIVIYHNTLLRSDSSALFFCLLALWLILRTFRDPSWKNQLLAGGAVGLSVSSRYTMIGLVFLMLLVDVIVLDRQVGKASLRSHVLGMIIGLIAVPLVFAITSPYFLLDYQTAMKDLVNEARQEHLGADNLSPLGNFNWYLSVALPVNVGFVQYLLAIVGTTLVLFRRGLMQILLVIYLLLFLILISIPALHWSRWTIQILPLLAFLAAFALDQGIEAIFTRFRLQGRSLILVWAISLIAVLGYNAYHTGQLVVQNARYSTRIVARQWLVEHLPAGSRIASDHYTAPLQDTSFAVWQAFSLATDHSLKDYIDEGFKYMIVSSVIFERFFAEPERYPQEVRFYNQLFKQEKLIAAFSPSLLLGGPEIRIYKITR